MTLRRSRGCGSDPGAPLLQLLERVPLRRLHQRRCGSGVGGCCGDELRGLGGGQLAGLEDELHLRLVVHLRARVERRLRRPRGRPGAPCQPVGSRPVPPVPPRSRGCDPACGERLAGSGEPFDLCELGHQLLCSFRGEDIWVEVNDHRLQPVTHLGHEHLHQAIICRGCDSDRRLATGRRPVGSINGRRSSRSAKAPPPSSAFDGASGRGADAVDAVDVLPVLLGLIADDQPSPPRQADGSGEAVAGGQHAGERLVLRPASVIDRRPPPPGRER